MAVTDTDIRDWAANYELEDTNTPPGPQLIDAELDDEIRNVKSVVRSISLNTQWERRTFENVNFINITNFAVAGDQTTLFTQNRKVRILHSAAPDYFGWVRSSTFDGTNTIVVTQQEAFGSSIQASIAEVQLGILTTPFSAVPASYVNTSALYPSLVSLTEGTALAYTANSVVEPQITAGGHAYHIVFHTPCARGTDEDPVTLNINGTGPRRLMIPKNTGVVESINGEAVLVPRIANVRPGDTGTNIVAFVMAGPNYGAPPEPTWVIVNGSPLGAAASELVELFEFDTSPDTMDPGLVSAGWIKLLSVFVLQVVKTVPIVANATALNIALPYESTGIRAIFGQWIAVSNATPPAIAVADGFHFTIGNLNTGMAGGTNVTAPAWVIAICDPA